MWSRPHLSFLNAQCHDVFPLWSILLALCGAGKLSDAIFSWAMEDIFPRLQKMDASYFYVRAIESPMLMGNTKLSAHSQRLALRAGESRCTSEPGVKVWLSETVIDELFEHEEWKELWKSVVDRVALGPNCIGCSLPRQMARSLLSKHTAKGEESLLFRVVGRGSWDEWWKLLQACCGLEGYD